MTQVAIGLGLRSGASEAAIVALVEAALVQARRLLPERDVQAAGLFTLDSKHGEPGLHAAALALALPLTFLPRGALLAADSRCPTRSPASLTHYGVGSVAEAAALAGAGPVARLLLARVAGSGVTCAVAVG